MKANFTKTLQIILTITLFSLLLFPGCENQTPLAPVETSSDYVAGNTTIDRNLRILNLGGTGQSLQKVTQVSQFIYAQSGGPLLPSKCV